MTGLLEMSPGQMSPWTNDLHVLSRESLSSSSYSGGGGGGDQLGCITAWTAVKLIFVLVAVLKRFHSSLMNMFVLKESEQICWIQVVHKAPHVASDPVL